MALTARGLVALSLQVVGSVPAQVNVEVRQARDEPHAGYVYDIVVRLGVRRSYRDDPLGFDGYVLLLGGSVVVQIDYDATFENCAHG